jgi:dynein heavy chain, axonemal
MACMLRASAVGGAIELHHASDVQVLSDAIFVKYLVEYDRDNMPERTLRQLSRVVEDPAFTPDQVEKQSKAAMSMCLWVRAMFEYGQIALVVAPKRAKLQDAEFSLDAMNAELRGKQMQLQVRS